MLYDYCIIGGGIVGLATAMKLLEIHPGARLIVIEKEDSLGKHQTGHNSGVIHAGIYYEPGSLKADLCQRGAIATKQFCTQHAIPFETCGKLLVATNGIELKRMDDLFLRSQKNGIKVEKLNKADMLLREPNIIGVGGLFVAETGIVDYKKICEAMAVLIRASGGVIEMSLAVTAIAENDDSVTIHASERRWQSSKLVVCAGLQSDRMARLSGIKTEHQIVPFRGEYFQLPRSKNDIVKHLIYPIPDPDLPFLGVHLTRMIDGSVTVGPNAVLGFAREGYPKCSFNVADIIEYALFPGFWKTLSQNMKSGLMEMRNSIFKRGYLAQCRKYCPSLQMADLLPFEAGIRAQAVMNDGTLIHDFLFLETPRMLHVCNAPSPAATSAIPIGEMIARKITGSQ